MLKASFLLSLALVLHVQLCSPLPIYAKVVPSSVAADEQGPEELAPVTEDHSDFIEERESVLEEHVPIVAGEVAQSPEESPPEEDLLVSSEELELVSIGDQAYGNAGAVSQESRHQEPLPAAPQESSEEDLVPVGAGLENESPEQHYVQVPAPDASVPLISLGVSEDETTEGNAEETALEEPLLMIPDDITEVEEKPLASTPEKSVDLVPAEHETLEAGQWEPAEGETPPGELSPEEPAVIIPGEPDEQEHGQEEQDETVLIILEEPEQEEEVEEESMEESAPEDPVVPLYPVEEELGQEEQVEEESIEESAPEDPVVPLYPVEEELEQEEQVEEDSVEESAPEDPVVPLYPVKEELEQEEQVEEESIEESAPEDPVVPLYPVEEELEQEEQVEEESIEESAPEDPVVPLYPVEEELEQEEQVEEESIEESAPEDPVVPLYPVEEELEQEEQVEEESIEESAPEDPVVPLYPVEEELEQEEQVEEESIEESAPEDPVVPLYPAEDEQKVEEESVPNSEQYTEVEATGVAVPVVPDKNAEQDLDINEEPLPNSPDEEVLRYAELDTEEGSEAEPATDKTAPEKPTVVVLVEPTSEKPAPEVPILIEEDTSKGTTEEISVQLDPFLKQAAVEEDSASQETEAGENNDEKLVPSENTEKAMHQALVNRGAVLGAALFTLMSFITIGFVWTTVSKKLR